MRFKHKLFLENSIINKEELLFKALNKHEDFERNSKVWRCVSRLVMKDNM